MGVSSEGVRPKRWHSVEK